MDEFIKYLALTIIGIVTLVVSFGEFELIPPESIRCGAGISGAMDKRSFVAGAVPAVSEFELLGLNEIDGDLGPFVSNFDANAFYESIIDTQRAIIPIGRLEDSSDTLARLPHVEDPFASKALILSSMEPRDLRSDDHFFINVDNTLETEEIGSAFNENAFQGVIEGIDNSLVVLYIRPSSESGDKPAFVSGFILIDKRNKFSDWIFIEPVRPLLQPLADEEGRSPRSKIPTINFLDGLSSRIREIPSFKSIDIDNCFKSAQPDNTPHILYIARGELTSDSTPESPPITQIPEFSERTPSALNSNNFITEDAPKPPNLNILDSLMDHDPIRLVKSGKKIVISAFTAPCFVPPGVDFTVSVRLANYTQNPLRVLRSTSFDDADVQLYFSEYDTDNRMEFNPSPPPFADYPIVFLPTENPIRAGKAAPAHALLRIDDPGIYVLRVVTTVSAMSRLVHVVDGPEKLTCADVEADPIYLAGVADVHFFDLYENYVDVKTWWEAQEEVLNLVSAFYTENFDALFPGDSLMQIEFLQGWSHTLREEEKDGDTVITDGAIPSGLFDAYDALCEYGQGRFSSGSGFESHQHDLGLTTLVNFFSGGDLGRIPRGPTDTVVLADVGSICDATCSRVGSSIIGLAEGLLGLAGSRSGSCSRTDYPITDPPSEPPSMLEIYNQSSHHLLSQHRPKLNFSRRHPHKNFQVTLFQRFLLMTHEVGHALGANHSEDITSMMFPSSHNATRFFLADQEKNEIRSCIAHCRLP